MITSFERHCTEQAISKLYKRMQLTAEPKVVWCQSPWQLILLPTLMPVLLTSPDSSCAASCRDTNSLIAFRIKSAAKPDRSPKDMAPLSALAGRMWDETWCRLQSTCDSIRWKEQSYELGACLTPQEGGLDGLLSSFINEPAQQLLLADLRQRVNRGYHLRDSRMNGVPFLAQFYEAITARLPESFPMHLLSLYADRQSALLALSRDALYLAKGFLQSNLHFLINNIHFLEIGNQGCACIFFQNTCFVLERPEKMSYNELNQLHKKNGPAMEFSDGYDVYALEGILVSRDLIEDAEWLTVARIYDESNQEQRRLMLKHYGVDRFIRDSQARKLSEDEFGVLYCKDLPHEQPLTFVKVVNATPEPDGSFRDYFLRVPPQIGSAKEAVAWTFGLRTDEYGPVWQT